MKISGFYYDKELENYLQSASLYPNKQLKSCYKEKIFSGEWKGDKAVEDVQGEKPGKNVNLNSIDKSNIADIWEDIKDPWNDDDKYSRTSIATAIFTDDFTIDVGNSWSDVGGDSIGSAWNGVKTMAPYISTLSSFLSDTGEQTQNQTQKYKDVGGNFMHKVGEALSKAGDFTKTLGKAAQRGLNVLGTSFTYYNGSAINFGSLGMKYTVLSQYTSDGKKFETVFDKARDILPYIVGPFIPVDVKEFGANFGASSSKFVKEFAFWQLAPGGFEPDMRNIDIAQKGTLKLRLGSYYSIPSLVIAGAQFNFSRQMVKNPDVKESGSINEDYLVPLSCEISLTLKPATRYSYNALVNLLNGKGTKEVRKALATAMKNSYDDTKDLYKEELNCKNTFYV